MRCDDDDGDDGDDGDGDDDDGDDVWCWRVRRLDEGGVWFRMSGDIFWSVLAFFSLSEKLKSNENGKK